MNKLVNIIAVETSPLISEGLAGILNKSGIHCRLSVVASLEDAELLQARKHHEVVIINPLFFNNNPKLFSTAKGRFERVKWVGLVYALYDPEIISMFDALITASDTPVSVTEILNKLLDEENAPEQSSLQEILTGREIDVLRLLATGHANKEIADKLNISIHTVITHRKNISQKTGIKTVSGLTIYAVTQKLISIDTIKE